MMRAKELYTKVIRNEETATEFLRRYQLLDEPVEIAPYNKCGGDMAEKRLKIRGEIRPVFRWSRKGCQTFRSVRHGNIFFSYTDLNNKIHCNLTLCEIIELVYYFVKDFSFDLTEEMTGRSRQTICDWFNMCREVCSSILSVEKRGKMVGTQENPVEIDEWLEEAGKLYVIGSTCAEKFALQYCLSRREVKWWELKKILLK